MFVEKIFMDFKHIKTYVYYKEPSVSIKQFIIKNVLSKMLNFIIEKFLVTKIQKIVI